MDHDQETAAVYAAQSEAMDFFVGHGSGADPTVPLVAEETTAFMRKTLDSLGEVAREVVDVEFGSTGHAALAGRYDFERNVIQLDTTELNRWKVLHEMAHWLDPKARSGEPDHGPAFRVLYRTLVATALGDEAGAMLVSMFTEFGVPCGEDNWHDVVAEG